MVVLVAGCATSLPPAGGRDWSHGLVIDASSSASTLFAYRWRRGARDRLPRIETYDAPCPPVKPGLGRYGGRPRAAAASLRPLLRCAIELVGRDSQAQARTSISLLGTAGLRLLPADEREEILAAVRGALDATPFGSTSARVISGDEEGVYGWLGVNYLLGRLDPDNPLPTVGALDLGGASAQITFVPREPPREHAQAITLAGDSYRLYTYSYLGLGQDRARRAVGSPACFLAGYPIPGGGVGTGNYQACRAAIVGAFAEPCGRAPCSLFGVYQPPAHGDFLAFSVYAYTARFFGIENRLSAAEMERAGREFCSRSWQGLIAEDPSVANSPFVPNYCFSAAYVVTLLAEGFGFPFQKTLVRAPFELRGEKVGYWALGALLYEIAGSAD